MGRPEGGPRDETPPVFVGSKPAPGATNVNTQRILISFNENVQVKDVMTKVVVSPPQKSMPKVSAVGRQVRIEMADTLLPNTTYTVDFSDAISDLNESNELEGFSFAFSTGPTIDSLEISGMVFQASNLEPAQGMLVGVYSNLSDTAITTVPFDRITRTNQYGQFTIRNLAPGTYRIFAVNDVNRDNKWDRSEDVAFYPELITPSASPVEVADTLLSATGEDSIVMRQATAFAPADILLTWFNEDYKPQYISKYERRGRNRIYLEFGAPCVEMPRVSFVGGPADGERIDRYVALNSSHTLDTLDYWIADSSFMMLDSMRLAVSYQKQDSLENLVWTTDTLNFNYRAPKGDKKKDDKKKKKDDEQADSAATPKIELLQLNHNLSATVDVFSPVVIKSSQPLVEFKPEMIHLEQMVDTVWNEIEMNALAMTDSLRPMQLTTEVAWQPGGRYRLTIDSLAMTGIYGLWNCPMKSEFSVRALGDYSNLTFNLSGVDGPAIVELLSSNDAPVRTVSVEGGRAVFRHVMPGTYYARLFIDRDSNGVYTNGKLQENRLPEDVYYYPKKLNLKKNWDVSQDWNLYETPVELQKPIDIKKNKPKVKKTDRNGRGNGTDDDDEYDDDQYYDEFGNPAVDPNDPFGKKKNSRYNTLNGRDRNYGTQGAGYR
ncbi:MAG: hypothetical protein HDS21_03465 [Bacteroides sp.]|nr:hypothetical protein [Bacteroides sp.]